MMWLLGRMPRTGDIMTWEEWNLEIVDLDGQRIDKVLATKLSENPKPEDGGSEEPSAAE